MFAKKFALVVLLSAAFCTGYLVSLHMTGGAINQRMEETVDNLWNTYAPQVVLIDVSKPEDKHLRLKVNGKTISQEAVRKALQDITGMSTFAPPGRLMPANYRVVIRAGKGVRWKDIVDVVQSCPGARIYDVWLDSAGILLPTTFRAYALDSRFLRTVYRQPTEVSVWLNWSGKMSGSEKGELSIEVGEMHLGLGTEGREESDAGAVEPRREEGNGRFLKTTDWSDVPGLIRQVVRNRWPSQRIRAIIYVDFMVPVADVVRAMYACLDLRSGYELRAPDY